MERPDIIQLLAAYRRPGSPVFARHFARLPPELTQRELVPELIDILADESLPPRVRDHAAGALGEIGDERAVEFLVDALASAKTRRGAAVALGRLRAGAAREPLAGLAARVPTARWALSELGVPDSSEGILADLRDGGLHGLRARVERLDGAQVREAERALLAQLSERMAQATFTHADAWIVSGLQYLRSADAESLLTQALLDIADPDHEAAGLRTRVIRALSALGTTASIAPLVEFFARVDDPIHKDVAANGIEAIARGHGSKGLRSIQAHAGRLKVERQRLAAVLRDTPHVEVERPWHTPPGSPKWAAAVARAIGKLDRLIT